jgi:hypothetical protein
MERSYESINRIVTEFTAPSTDAEQRIDVLMRNTNDVNSPFEAEAILDPGLRRGLGNGTGGVRKSASGRVPFRNVPSVVQTSDRSVPRLITPKIHGPEPIRPLSSEHPSRVFGR